MGNWRMMNCLLQGLRRENHSIRTVSSQSAPAKPCADNNSVKSDVRKAFMVCFLSSSPLSTPISCEHLICSSRLAGALNIIREKDMRCATSDKAVNDF